MIDRRWLSLAVGAVSVACTPGVAQDRATGASALEEIVVIARYKL